MRILGVDPGTLRTGIGVIETQGNRYQLVFQKNVTAKATLPIAKRLFEIFEQTLEIFETFRPEVLALEDVFYGKDVKAMVKLGEARACAMLVASKYQVEVVEYAPSRVKQAVTGNGHATKEQMQQMVKTLLGLKEIPSSDSADALAIAICHAHSGHRSATIKSKKKKMTWETKLNLIGKK